jgi:hypothetical protein
MSPAFDLYPSAVNVPDFLAESPYFDYHQFSGKRQDGLRMGRSDRWHEGLTPQTGMTAVVVVAPESDLSARSAWHQWFMDDAAATTAPFMKHDRFHAEFLIR